MERTIAIARRELLAYFATPVGYVVIFLFLFVSGVMFTVGVLLPGQAATMRQFFDLSVFLLLFIAPAISMRLISEEFRLGTIEPLMTCPVSDMQVILGKWAASVGFFVMMLLPTLLFVVVLEMYSTPDYGPIIGGYLGLVMIGALYLASGILASTLWSSQILAYLIALFFWLVFWGLTSLLPHTLASGRIADLLFWFSVNYRFNNDFAKGVLDLSTIVYFASATVFFLVISVKVLESRRWR